LILTYVHADTVQMRDINDPTNFTSEGTLGKFGA